MKINVIDDKGAERSATVVTSFRLSNKKYVIYSFFEEESGSSTRIYISELRVKQKNFSFNNIINDNEWDLVKRLMKDFAKGVSNLNTVLANYDVEVVPFDKIMEENEYVLATIKDSKVVKVSSKFIEGLVGTYEELKSRIVSDEQTNEDVPEEKIVENTSSAEVSADVEETPNDEQTSKDEDTKQKMKDIWEYSSMLQKKIAKDMRSLNSKVVKLNGEVYYVDVKDPLYLKEKIELQVPDIESDGDDLLKELEPLPNVSSSSDDSSIFSQLEKELSGINDNFNRIVAKNQEEKAKVASEIEKRLKDVAIKEKQLTELEERLNAKEEELRLREEELEKANERLEEDVRSLTKYASMINSMMNEEEK